MGRKRLHVFVATGTHKPFHRLLRAARLLLANDAFELFVQRGPASADFHDLPGEDFIPREQFATRLAWADVVVCHGGAGSLYEAYRAGHTPIVVPRLARHGEHVNDHQLELARALEKDGHALVCECDDDLVALVRRAPHRRENQDILGEKLTAVVREALLVETMPRRPPLVPALWSIIRSLVDRFKELGAPAL